MHIKSSPETGRFSIFYQFRTAFIILSQAIYLFCFFCSVVFFLVEYEQLTEDIIADDDQYCGDYSCNQQIYTHCGQYLHHYHIQDQCGYSGQYELRCFGQHRCMTLEYIFPIGKICKNNTCRPVDNT